MKVKNNIILALDVMDIIEGYNICEQLTKEINTIKIGYPLTLAEGIECINILKENFNFNIICDYKVADIPATNSKISDITFKSGADAIICHGFVGEDSIKACQNKAEEYGKELFLLTEMSHPGAKTFIQAIADDIAKLGIEMGITNFVAPSTRIDRLRDIRNIVGKNSFIISPGVGTQGGNPKETLKYSDGLIIGRSIYLADNPQKATQDIIKTLK